MSETKYTYLERMAFELGLQTAKTAIQFLDSLSLDEKKDAIDAIESRGTEQFPEMRVMEPARKNIKNLN